MRKIVLSLTIIFMLVFVTTAASLNIKLEKENVSKNIVLNNPPDRPTVTGPTSGKAGTSYRYTAVTTDPERDKIFYYFNWGDGNEMCTNLVNSGQSVEVSHT